MKYLDSVIEKFVNHIKENTDQEVSHGWIFETAHKGKNVYVYESTDKRFGLGIGVDIGYMVRGVSTTEALFTGVYEVSILIKATMPVISDVVRFRCMSDSHLRINEASYALNDFLLDQNEVDNTYQYYKIDAEVEFQL